MKGKVTWKPLGHSAKKWREAARVRGSASLLSPSRPSKAKQPGGKRPRDFKTSTNP